MSIIGYALGTPPKSRSETIPTGKATPSPADIREVLDGSRSALRRVRSDLESTASATTVANARDELDKVDNDLGTITRDTAVKNETFAEGVGRVRKALEALVPAEALLLNGGLLLATVSIPSEEGGAFTISNAPFLIWGTVAIALITLVIYYGAILVDGRKWEKADNWRMLVPVGAYLGWSLLQPVSAFVLMGSLSDKGVRLFVGLAIGILVGIVANVRDSRARA